MLIQYFAFKIKKIKKKTTLFKKNLNETVYKIYLERKKTYNEADFRIKCDLLKTEMIAKKIFKIYENSKIKFKNMVNNYSILIGKN